MIRYSSMRLCRVSRFTSEALPLISSAPEPVLSLVTASTTSPWRNSAFHSGSVSVVVATYFAIPFIFLPKSPVASSICGQAALKPSYVRRPSSSASASMRLLLCQAPSSSLKYGPLQAGSSKTPSRVTYSTAMIFPMPTGLRVVAIEQLSLPQPGPAALPQHARLQRMKLDEILRRRIDRHHLGSAKAGDVVAAARRVGGLHAQVASSALASATLRLGSEPDLEAALYRQKSLVRTWAARGTLHL